MIPFVVSIEEGQGVWVLAVDPVGERVLGVDPETKALIWYPMDKCTFVRILKPDEPVPVVLVQPAGPKIVAPQGADFKHGLNGG